MRRLLSSCLKSLFQGGVLLVVAASIPLVADTIIIGAPADVADGNRYPFGCNSGSFCSGEYQQVYTSSLFSEVGILVVERQRRFVAVVAVGDEQFLIRHRSEEHTSELQSLRHLVCRLLLEK